MTLLTFLYASLGINLLLGVVASIKKTDLLTDISYGLTFILLLLLSFFSTPFFSIVKFILLLLLMLWALRISIYLLVRILKTKKDSRFDGIRENPIRFLSFWFLQGITVWVVLLPTLVLFLGTSNLFFNWITILGAAILLLGLVIETVADIQKFKFKSDSNNKGRWIDTGLWRYSRHPNYLGEIMVWVGVFVYVLPYINNLDLLTIISPIFIYTLLTKVSGIPTLERKHEEKYKGNEEYVGYRERTGRLLFKYNR